MQLLANSLVVEYQLRGGAALRALDGVSLGIAPGEAVAVMGASGSGKSTLALALKGLVDLAAGTVLASASRGPGSQRMALVLQRPESALFAETVEEELAFAARVAGVDASERRELVGWALAAVGLDESFRQRDPFSLSGGEQRRVAIAAALTVRPELLLLDEPTAGLDAPARAAVRATLRSLRDSGVGVVLVTHALDEAAAVCRRLVVLSAGRVVFDAPLAELWRDPSIAVSLGLQLPVAVEVAAAVGRARGLTPPATADEAVLTDFVAEALRGGTA